MGKDRIAHGWHPDLSDRRCGGPDTLFVGTRPDAFRSHDGGKTWEALSLGVTLPCPIGIPRTTNMIVDPRDHHIVWAGIEVDGVYQSRDGGDNWVHLPALGPDPFQGDIHGLALRTGKTTAVYATTPFGIATSTDEGRTGSITISPSSTRQITARTVVVSC